MSEVPVVFVALAALGALCLALFVAVSAYCLTVVFLGML